MVSTVSLDRPLVRAILRSTPFLWLRRLVLTPLFVTAFIWAWLIFAWLVALATNSVDTFYALAGAGFALLTALSFTVLR